MKPNQLYRVAILIFIGFLVACSTEKTGVLNKKYHATTTKYNILYNGNVSYDRGVQMVKKKYHDNFQEILTVEQTQQDEQAIIITQSQEKNPHFQKAEEKAIKAAQLHSMYAAGKEHNPQMDEAYMLLGKSRYHDMRFLPAIEAFNYIILKYPDSDLYYDAIVWREKTNIKLKYSDLAVSNIKKLLKNDQIKDEVKSDALATLAQGYINLEHLDSAKLPLKQAIELTSDVEKKGRYTYILGQLNSKTNAKSEAIQNFQDVIDYNRRIPRALVINAYAAKFQNQDFSQIDTAQFTKEYLTLLNDRENRPYADVIFHQLGVMNDKANNAKGAVKNYNQSLKVGKTNDFLKYENYSKLADLYYRKKNFETAGLYYDSTMMYINPLSKEYVSMKRRRNNMVDIVKYEQIARTNDSLLHLVNLDEPTRRATIQKVLDDRKIADEEKEKAQQAANASTSKKAPTAPGQSSSFYFYSTNALTKGKDDFKKRWGNRQEGDNWRWANRVQTTTNSEANIATTDTTTPNPANQAVEDMRYNVDFFMAQLPKDKKEIAQLKTERDDAYYQLGMLYSTKLDENEVAIDRYERLLTFEPESELEQATKYQLYKLYLKINPARAQALLQDMKSKYPDSRYTKIMLDPNAVIDNTGSAVASYENIYSIYRTGAYVETLEELERIIPTIFNDNIISKYELLKATTIGKLYGLDEYQKALQHVAMTYQSTEEGKEAQRILSKEIPQLRKMTFKNDLSKNLKMIYVVNYPLSSEDQELKTKLERYAIDRKHTGISFSADMYDEHTMFLVIHGIKSGNLAKSAQIYLEIDEQYGIKKEPILISSNDYAVVLIKKNWNEYLQSRN